MLYSPPLTRSQARVLGRHPSIQKSVDALNILCSSRRQKRSQVSLKSYENKDGLDLSKVENQKKLSPGLISRRKRTLKLSKEEQAMAGAPEGSVYQVEVLSRDDFTQPGNCEEDIQIICAAANALDASTEDAGRSDWGDQYAAIDSVRRMAIFCPDKFSTEPAKGTLVLAKVMGLLQAGASNLRSSMVRNSLLGYQDLYHFLGKKVATCRAEETSALLLQIAGGDKKFLRQVAGDALESMICAAASSELLFAFLNHSSDKNPTVSGQSFMASDRCLTEMVKQHNQQNSPGTTLEDLLNWDNLLPLLWKGVTCKSQEGRAAAKKALRRSRHVLGEKNFEARVDRIFKPADAVALRSALQAKKSTVGSKKAPWAKDKISIRERLLAANKENQIQNSN